MSNINNMTRKEFDSLPLRKWSDDIGEFRTLVVLPLRRKHDSGYRLMDFVAADSNDKPICRLSGCSDVIHLDGIGGFGYRWIDAGGVPKSLPPKGWCIDCLPVSGLLRLFADRDLIASPALSSFELFAIVKT